MKDWDLVIHIIKLRLASWKRNMLSQVGRLVLLHSILSIFFIVFYVLIFCMLISIKDITKKHHIFFRKGDWQSMGISNVVTLMFANLFEMEVKGFVICCIKLKVQHLDKYGSYKYKKKVDFGMLLFQQHQFFPLFKCQLQQILESYLPGCMAYIKFALEMKKKMNFFGFLCQIPN